MSDQVLAFAASTQATRSTGTRREEALPSRRSYKPYSSSSSQRRR